MNLEKNYKALLYAIKTEGSAYQSLREVGLFELGREDFDNKNMKQ